MAIYQPIKEEKRFSNTRTTKLTYTKRYTTNGYINSEARTKPTYCL